MSLACEKNQSLRQRLRGDLDFNRRSLPDRRTFRLSLSS